MNLMEHKSMAREVLKLLILTARCIGDLYSRSLFFTSHLGSCFTLKLCPLEEEALKATEEGEKLRIIIRILCFNDYFSNRIFT